MGLHLMQFIFNILSVYIINAKWYKNLLSGFVFLPHHQYGVILEDYCGKDGDATFLLSLSVVE
jgi:hypothetical protein